MRTWVSVQSVWNTQYLKERRKKMKDNFHIGFVVGLLAAFFMAVVISCTVTPLEAGGSDCGSSWNPCYVKIVD